jgi:hypothetical protein
LSIVRRLLRLHGSDIYVESQLGVGSRFYFTLPAVSPRAQERSALDAELRRCLSVSSLVTLMMIEIAPPSADGAKDAADATARFDAVAAILAAQLPRAHDVVVAQPHCGRFAILLPMTARVGALAVKSRLEPALADGPSPMAVVKGPVLAPEDGATLSELLSLLNDDR